MSSISGLKAIAAGVAMAAGLAGCAGDRVPVGLVGAPVPVTADGIAFTVGSSESGRRAVAYTDFELAPEASARRAALGVFGGRCAGRDPDLSLYSDIVYPDGRREWSYTALCPTTQPPA